jgi:hypothetical protein
MAELRIRIKRAADGSAALSCVRADGSTTWQRQTGAYAFVFPEHDLSHFVVETTLCYRRGFFGLIVEGWDITDFAPPYPRGPVPLEAREVEAVVGVFTTERRMGGGWTAQQVREQGGRFLAAGRANPGIAFPPLTDEQVARVRVAHAELFARWAATPPGGTLELEFSRPETNIHSE